VSGKHVAAPSCDRRRQKVALMSAALPNDGRYAARPKGHVAEGHVAEAPSKILGAVMPRSPDATRSSRDEKSRYLTVALWRETTTIERS